MSQQFINIVGRSGSGKTALIEKLIAYYTARGLKIAVVKSTRHDFDAEPSGKDTARYRGAGAFGAVITNGAHIAVTAERAMTPPEIAEKYFPDADIIIIEGYKEGSLRKIEVVGDSPEPPLYLSGAVDFAIIVSDKNLKADMPVYARNDVAGIVNAIERLIFS